MTRRQDLPNGEGEISQLIGGFASGTLQSLELDLLESGFTPLSDPEKEYVKLGAEAALDYLLYIYAQLSHDKALDLINDLNMYLKMHNLLED